MGNKRPIDVLNNGLLVIKEQAKHPVICTQVQRKGRYTLGEMVLGNTYQEARQALLDIYKLSSLGRIIIKEK